jgi:acetyltransferase
VNGIEELYQYGNMLAVQPLIKGKRIAILTNSGGPGSAMSNTLEKGGMEVPRFSEELQEKIRPLMPSHAPCGNPVDMTFSLDLEALTNKIPRLVLASGEVDGIILHGVFRSAYLAARYSHFKDFLNNIPLDELVNQLPNVSQELVSVASEFGIPMAVSSFYGIKDDYASAYVRNNIPVFGTPEKTAGAMIILQRYREIHDRKPYQTAEASLPSSGAAKMIREALLGRQKNFDEFGSKRFLDHYGIPVTKDILVASEEETASTADMLGYPLVLKASVEDILHKTGKDLISLNQKTRDDAVAAFRSIQQSAGRRVPVIMCRMVRGEREFVAGVVRTPEFGPSVMFGLGGIFTEAIEDTVFRPAPSSETDAEEMLMDLRSKKLFGEFRGMPAVNTRSLALLLHRLSLIPVMHPEVSEIDINPIIIEDSEPVAVDALVVFSEME